MKNLVNKKINDLVSEDYVFGYVLHYFGISFYDYPENTLEEVCNQRGLEMSQVQRELESIHKPSLTRHTLISYPVDLIIQYLKHSHHHFICQKLPYMARLIEDLNEDLIPNAGLVRDLKVLFPLFVEDFIHHIHDEEDTLFKYVLTLQRASLGDYQWGGLYYQMKKYQMSFFALDHHSHDDEMRGIREFTRDYELGENPSLHLQVLFSELEALEEDLKIHAQIEDELLMPKGLRLESLVKEMIKQHAKYN
jgi:regulator of cell morphogenesis and NO signaling